MAFFPDSLCFLILDPKSKFWKFWGSNLKKSISGHPKKLFSHRIHGIFSAKIGTLKKMAYHAKNKQNSEIWSMLQLSQDTNGEFQWGVCIISTVWGSLSGLNLAKKWVKCQFCHINRVVNNFWTPNQVEHLLTITNWKYQWKNLGLRLVWGPKNGLNGDFQV